MTGGSTASATTFAEAFFNYKDGIKIKSGGNAIWWAPTLQSLAEPGLMVCVYLLYSAINLHSFKNSCTSKSLFM